MTTFRKPSSLCGSLVLALGFLGTNLALQRPASAQSSEKSKPDLTMRRVWPPLPKDLRKYFKPVLRDEDSTIEEAGFRWESFDLNGDRVPEYFVEGFCSPTGNCELWVLQKMRRGYRELLRTDLVNDICVRPTQTKGYLDIETASHISAFDSGVTVFKFVGGGYLSNDQYEVRWEYDDKTGKSRQVEGPVRPASCHELFAR